MTVILRAVGSTFAFALPKEIERSVASLGTLNPAALTVSVICPGTELSTSTSSEPPSTESVSPALALVSTTRIDEMADDVVMKASLSAIATSVPPSVKLVEKSRPAPLWSRSTVGMKSMIVLVAPLPSAPSVIDQKIARWPPTAGFGSVDE